GQVGLRAKQPAVVLKFPDIDPVDIAGQGTRRRGPCLYMRRHNHCRPDNKGNQPARYSSKAIKDGLLNHNYPRKTARQSQLPAKKSESAASPGADIGKCNTMPQSIDTSKYFKQRGTFTRAK